MFFYWLSDFVAGGAESNYSTYITVVGVGFIGQNASAVKFLFYMHPISSKQIQ